MMHEDEIKEKIITMRNGHLDDNEIYTVLSNHYPPAEVSAALQSLQSSPNKGSKNFHITKKTAFRSFMIFLLMITLYWFVSSGWSSIIFGSIDDGLSAISIDDSITSGMKRGLNCIWILFSDPGNYNTICMSPSPDQDELYGLEFGEMTVTPKKPLTKSPAKLYFILENKGTIDIRTATVKAFSDDDFTDSGGKFDNPNTSIEISGSKEFQLFLPFTTPRCPGSYRVGAELTYDYSGTSILNLDIMDSEEYRIRSEQDQLEKKDVISQSTTGPVTLLIQTSNGNSQPLSSEYPFSLIFRLENSREGTATLKQISFEIPEILAIKEGGYCDLEKQGEIYVLKDTKKSNKIPSRSEADPLMISCDFDIDPVKAEEITITRTYFIKSSFDYGYTLKKDTRFETQGTGLEDGC